MREEAAVLTAVFTYFSHVLLSIELASKILTPIPLLESGSVCRKSPAQSWTFFKGSDKIEERDGGTHVSKEK